MPKNLGLIAFGVTALLSLGATWRAEDRNPPRSLESVVHLAGSWIRDVQTPVRIVASEMISPAEEMRVGDRMASWYRQRAVVGTKTHQRLERVGKRVAEGAKRDGIRYRFTLLPDGAAHAFAICGGHVFVTEGMMRACETDAELAGVLGHEVAHIDLRHTIDAVWETRLRGPEEVMGMAGRMMRLAYSEELEARADQYGVILAERAGYLPSAVLELFTRLDDVPRNRPERDSVGSMMESGLEAYLATHPPFAWRIAVIERLIDTNRLAWRGKRYEIDPQVFGPL